MQKSRISYAVKVELSFIDEAGHSNSYNETVAICTNIADAQNLQKATKNAFIVQTN